MQEVFRFKNIQKLKLDIWHSFHVQGSIQLPKTLQHLILNGLIFDDITFLSSLISLKSLELYKIKVSSTLLRCITHNCLKLQYLSIDGEFSIHFLKLHNNFMYF